MDQVPADAHPRGVGALRGRSRPHRAGQRGAHLPARRLKGAGPATDYDEFVDWEKRLAREGPFFRDVFAEAGVRRVVDVGCGSGRHALLFASWGLDVVGVDPDPEMLAAARANALAAGSDVPFLEGGFGGVAALAGSADALTCTGNALPHVSGVEGLREALADFAAVVRPGGVLVLHMLNHDRLVDGRVRSVPPVVRDTPEGTKVFLRVLDHLDGGIRFDFLTLTRPPAGEWGLSARSSVHTVVRGALLADELEQAGFVDIAFFGDHARTLFDPLTHESVVVTAGRA